MLFNETENCMNLVGVSTQIQSRQTFPNLED